MPPGREVHQVCSTDSGLRIDRFLAVKCPEFSRSYFKRLIRQGHVRIDGRETEPDHKVATGERVSVFFPPPAFTGLVPESLPLEVVYEDDDVIVVDKPAGLTVYPGPGHPSRTLVNALLVLVPELALLETTRPGIVHRLDKDTSGVMAVAKHRCAYQHLVSQFRSRSVRKGYLVLVKGRVTPERGVINLPIGRNPANRKTMAVTPSGREARTEYRVAEQAGDFALLEVNPVTGRTHQIRVHLKAVGYPVAGDAVYGVRSPYLARQFVHAHRLGFRLPPSDRYREFTAGLPEDLKEALRSLGFKGALSGNPTPRKAERACACR
ncbi:MAG: RluA family pseudouridine synthase [Chloroflexota bacterium]